MHSKLSLVLTFSHSQPYALSQSLAHNSSGFLSASIDFGVCFVSFDLTETEIRLRLLDWRNDQMEAITFQLEDAYPRLAEAIVDHVSGLSPLEVGRASVHPKKLAEALLAPWAEEQSNLSISRAEASLSDLISMLPRDRALDGHIKSALPAIAGVGMLAASVTGGLKTAIVLAAALSTSKVAIPVLFVGGAVMAGMSIAGVKVFDHAIDKMRANLIIRIQKIALSAVFGFGLSPEDRYLLSDLQAAVLTAGERELETIA